MENQEPDKIPHTPIQLADADSDENGCPCTLEIHNTAEPDIMDRFEVLKDPSGKNR